MSTGLLCIGAVLIVGAIVIFGFQVIFSPARAFVGPCDLSEVPGLCPTPAQRAVADLGFASFDPFGARAVLRSFEALGFQQSGAVVIRNPPVPDVYAALLSRHDADVRVWIQPDGTPGTAAVISAAEGVRVVTSGLARAATSHEKEDVEAFPDASPLALVRRHEQRMVGRAALEHTADNAVQRYIDEWSDDLAALKRRSFVARAAGWLGSRVSG